jgi:hypothetical protein
MPKRLELIPLTTYQFQGAANTIQDVQLVKYIHTGGFVSGLLEVRPLSKSIPNSQTIAIVLQAISLADDEPEATYASALNEVVASIVTGTTTPGLLTTALIAPVPAAYRLLVRGIQPVGVTTVFNATLSASLTLRES